MLCMPTVADDTGLTDATVKSYEDQLTSIVTKQKQALNDLADIRSSQADAGEEIGKYDELLKYNNDMRDLASGELESLSTQIAANIELISDTEARLEKQETAFLERMVAVYMEDDADVFELLFGAGDLTDFLTKIDRVNAIFDYDNNIITDLEENKQTLEKAKSELVEAEKRQKQRVDDYESAIKQTQQIYDAKLEYMDNLKNDESKLVENYTYLKGLENDLNAELEEYLAEIAREQERKRKEEEERRRREEEAARLAAEEAARQQQEAAQQEQQNQSNQSSGWDGTGYSIDGDDSYTYTDNYSYGASYDTDSSYYTYSGGQLNWPLEPGTAYFISSEQGWRDLYGMSDYHLGLDIACDNGTPVRAAEGGTVLKSESHASYGNYVLIDHGNGISTLYAHMFSRNVSAGDAVYSGQVIGWVGLTGNTYGYHLHFEVRESGTVVNPRNYLVFP